MRNRFSSIVSKIDWKLLLFFLIIGGIFFTNSLHESYPDEFDSIYGGKLIREGLLPYRDWFQHHNPGAYVLASIILPFSGISFVHFRIILSFVYFLIFIGSYFLLRARAKRTDFTFYLFFIFISAISATYFWGQMLLADTFSSYLFIPVFTLLLVKTFSKETLKIVDCITISIFLFLTWLTSMTYSYLILGTGLYAMYLYTVPRLKVTHVSKKEGFISKLLLKLILLLKTLCIVGGILIIPFLIYFIFLLITGSLDDWYFSNISYNQNFYIYNYPHEAGSSINPIRYAVIITKDFTSHFLPLILSVKNLAFNDIPVTLTLTALAMGFFAIIKRKYVFILFFLYVLIFSNSRTNPAELYEKNYQVYMYVTVILLTGMYLIFELKKMLDFELHLFSHKLIASIFFIGMIFYWSVTFLFLGQAYFEKIYAKYMGTAPAIYDRPQVAPVLNQILTEKDYVWIGPFEFEELFYTNAKPASKYHWFLNHAVSSDKIKNELIADLQKNNPKIIVFNRNYSPWGGNPKDFNYFFTDYLDKKYIRLFEYNQLQEKQYKWKIDNTQNFDIDGMFYLNKEFLPSLLSDLSSKNLLYSSSAENNGLKP
jgi:hypothetical protein